MASAWRASLNSHDSTGTLYINTIGVKMDPVSGDGLSPTDLAAAVNTWIGATYRALLPTRLTFDSITVREMFVPDPAEGVHAVALAGTYPETMNAPRMLCAIAAWKTDVATRSGRGHIALPLPLNAALIGGDNLNGASGYVTTTAPAFFDALDAGHDWTSGGVTEGHLSHVVLSVKNAAYYDVKTRLLRSQIRWIERRQTAP